MTLISAFRCYEGAVLCADSQETIDVPGYGQYRVRVNKLEPQTAGDYELVVGGSGDGDLVDGFMDSFVEAASVWPRLDQIEMRRAIKRELIDYHRNDVAASHATGEDKNVSFVFCLKYKNDPHVSLWKSRGVTVRQVNDLVLLGWEEPIYWREAARLYRPNASCNQSILLGIHLFALAKETSNVISGETRVILALDNGMHIVDPQDVSELEGRLKIFNKMVDDILLALPDTSIPIDEFKNYVTNFRDEVVRLHDYYTGRVVSKSLGRALFDPNWRGDPNPQLPVGTRVEVRRESDGRILEFKHTFHEVEDLLDDSLDSEEKE